MAADTTLPTVPQGVSANATSPTSVDVSWQASQDNVGVAGYDVYRNGTLVITLPGSATAWTDNSAQPPTPYSYTVDAYDAAGNHSAQSQPGTTTTPPRARHRAAERAPEL